MSEYRQPATLSNLTVTGKGKRRDANSSIFKYVEMHPGKYEISVWYNGRNQSYEGSNDIDISLQVLRPQMGVEKNYPDEPEGE